MMGANRCLLDLILALKPYPYTPTVLIPYPGPIEQSLQERKISYHILPYYNWAWSRFYKKQYWFPQYFMTLNENKYIPHIVSWIKGNNFDCIYTNSSQTGIGAQCAELTNLPHIWHIREYGELDYQFIFYKGRKYFNTWANKAAAIISMSQGITNTVLVDIKAPVYSLHDGIIQSSVLQNISPRTQVPKDFWTFLIIGAIHPAKRQFEVLKAFRSLLQTHKNVHLKIVGKGRKLYLLKMKFYAFLYGMNESVQFIPYVSNPYEEHVKSDVLIMNSKSEGMGRVTLESMVVGNPVIGYASGGTIELIHDKVDGYLYQGGIKELTQCMKSIMSNVEQYQRMSKNGRKKIEEKYTLELFGEKINNILSFVLKSE